MRLNSVYCKVYRQRGFSLLELLVVVVIISSLALIASPYLTGASTKAKLTAVKGNVASAAMTAAVLLNLDEMTPETAIPEIVRKCNYPESKTGKNSETSSYVPSPFDAKLKAFGAHGPGQVDIAISQEPYGITIQGFDNNSKPIASARKFVPFD